MALKTKEMNPNSKSVIKTGEHVYYWDKTKLKMLELLLDRDYSVNELAKELGISRDKVLAWLNDEEFKKVYKRYILASLNEIQLQAQDYLKDLMKQLKNRVDVTMNELKGNHAVSELRKLLQLATSLTQSESEKESPPKEGDKILNIFSPEIAKKLEEIYLKKQGIEQLDIQEDELKNIQNQTSNKENKDETETSLNETETRDT